MFLFEPKSFQTLHRQQHNWNVPMSWNVATTYVQRHHAGSGSALVPPHACVMYCRERTSTRKTVEMKMWNKCYFSFLCAFVYSRGFVKLQLTDWCYMDYFTNLLAMFLDMGTFQLLLSMEGLKALRFKPKHLNLCSDDEREVWRVWNDIRVST